MRQNLVTELFPLSRVVLLLLSVLAFHLASPAKASDLQAFHGAVEGVNRPLTSALFYLRTGNTGLAGLDLTAANSRWMAFQKKFEASPPKPFDKDDGWKTSLSAITAALEAGTSQADAGNGKAAGEALLPIKDELYQLRKRNGLRVLADCVFDLGKKMDALYHYRKNPPDLAESDVRLALSSLGRDYENLILECRQLAPEALHQNKDFLSLFDGAAKSIKSIGGPISSRDQRGVINVLRELRSFDRLIWLRWG